MLWNSIGIAGYFGCQWLLTVLVVHLNSGYTEAGILSLAMSVTTALYGCATLNLRTFQVSALEEPFTDGDFLINRLLASGVSFLLCVFFVVYKDYSWQESLCILAFMAVRVSEALSDVLQGIAQKAWRLDIAGKSFLLRGIAGLIAFLCGELFFGNLLVAILLMAASAYLIIFLYDFQMCKSSIQIDFSFTKRGVLGLLKVGIPLAAYGIFLNATSTVPRIQIEAQYGQELLGIFSSVATPTVLIPQLAGFIFNPLMGVFATYRKAGDKHSLYRLFVSCAGAITLIGALALVAGYLFGEWALALLFGNTIRDYTGLLIPIIGTAILTAVIWLLCGILIVFKDYCILAGIAFASLVVCFFLSSPLVAANGLIGAVFALALALSLECVLLGLRVAVLLFKTDRRCKHE